MHHGHLLYPGNALGTGNQSQIRLWSCPVVYQLAGYSAGLFHRRTQTIEIVIEARTPTPVTRRALIHLRVGRASEKGLWAHLAEPLRLWSGN